MSSETSDEDLMRNVCHLRDRLMQTENSLRSINRPNVNVTEWDGMSEVAAKLSSSEPYLHSSIDSVNIPPPLTLDDLGELTTHDETDYSPVDESVLRQWNMNKNPPGKQDSRSSSPESETQMSYRSCNNSSRRISKQNLKKNLSSPKLIRPSISSPNVGQPATHSGHAFSYDDLSAVNMQEIFATDSYRMLKQPSATSHFSASAPISPRKERSQLHCQDVSPSFSDTVNERPGRFELIAGISMDSSISALANYSLQSPQKVANDSVINATLSEQGKENMTPTRPISARSNATSVTMLGAEAESDKLRGRLSMLREDNERLHTLVSSLQEQLEVHKLKKSKNDPKPAANFKEQILSLKEEAEASEKALRRAEEALERSEMVWQRKTENIVSLQDEVSHLKSLLTESEISKESAIKNYKEVYQDAQHLAQQLEEVESKLNHVKNESSKENTRYRHEIQNLEKTKIETSEKVARLQHAICQLQSDLRTALRQVESRDIKVSERDSEKVHVSRALQDLQARFAEVRAELRKKTEGIEDAHRERLSLRKKLESVVEHNALQQDRLASCQQEVEEYRIEIRKLESELKAAKLENQRNNAYSVTGPVDSGRGVSITVRDTALPNMEQDNCHCEAASPRKQKAVIAELKMKLAAKEAQIQRLEARMNNFSMEAEKLEGIRGELINVVERSRLGDKRAHELEGIVHQLEDERSKVTRQLMEREDELNDKKVECESLESRLLERTRTLTMAQNQVEDRQKMVTRLEEEVNKSATKILNLEKRLESKSHECESQYEALRKAKDELSEKKKALDNAAEWAGKRESESKRETEKMKRIHMEQHNEMEAQVDKLQLERNRYREQTRELECVVCQLRDENDVASKRISSTEKGLAELRSNDARSRQENQMALKILETKANESSEEVLSLRNTLAQCKNDLRQYIEQLQEATSKFQHQMAVKHGQVAKLESELKVAQDSLKSESLHAKALESNLSEKQEAIQQASSRIAELEDCQICFKSKVAKLENHLGKVHTKSQQDRQYWEGRLQTACAELEAKNKQFTQLNDALKEVDREFTSCKKELSNVESKLEKLRSDSDNKSEKLQLAQTETQKARLELAAKNEKVSNLEGRLEHFETETQRLQQSCISQENALAKLKAELECVSQKSVQVQSALQATDTDSKKKDTFISRLQNALREAKENLLNKEQSVEELERALEDRQWELQQRAAQLGQLEVSVKEHKSISEKRQIELQAEARKAGIELKDRNQQISTLDEQLSELKSELSEERHRAEEKDQELKRVNRDVEQKDERVADLEKALEESRTAYEERHRACLEVTQELRVAREQSQRAAQQWQDTQRELERLQKQQELLISDLETIGKNEKEKGNHVTELAGKLLASQAEKADVERKYAVELDRMRNDVLKMHQQHQDEVSRMRNEHICHLNDVKTKAGDRSDDLRVAIKREAEARRECESLRGVVASLEKELLARIHVIEAANDTIVVKEAEVARLEAKLAGIEREKRMQGCSSPEKAKEYETDPPDFLPSFHHSKDLCETSKADWLVQSDHSQGRHHGFSTLFSDLDPNSTSLSPSFAPIAASTKRPDAVDNTLTGSLLDPPDGELDMTSTEIEESLFARVFGRHGNYDKSSQVTPDANGSIEAPRHSTEPNFELRPEHCMADLRERLRNSEQRRQEVTSKLRELKSSNQA